MDPVYTLRVDLNWTVSDGIWPLLSLLIMGGPTGALATMGSLIIFVL